MTSDACSHRGSFLRIKMNPASRHGHHGNQPTQSIGIEGALHDARRNYSLIAPKVYVNEVLFRPGFSPYLLHRRWLFVVFDRSDGYGQILEPISDPRCLILVEGLGFK